MHPDPNDNWDTIRETAWDREMRERTERFNGGPMPVGSQQSRRIGRKKTYASQRKQNAIGRASRGIRNRKQRRSNDDGR